MHFPRNQHIHFLTASPLGHSLGMMKFGTQKARPLERTKVIPTGRDQKRDTGGYKTCTQQDYGSKGLAKKNDSKHLPLQLHLYTKYSDFM